MNAQEKHFIEDLKAICKKHDVCLKSSEDYDSNENCGGTHYTFVGNGNTPVYLDLEDVEDELLK